LKKKSHGIFFAIFRARYFFMNAAPNQGIINTIVATGIALEDAPTFCGKHAYQAKLDAVVATGIATKDAPSYAARRAQDSRRICTIFCATENCKIRVQQIDGYCNPCHKLVPKKLTALPL
jgi:hypothetical protein